MEVQDVSKKLRKWLADVSDDNIDPWKDLEETEKIFHNSPHDYYENRPDKSEEEDVVGNYFKPHRASRLVAQAKETQRSKLKRKKQIYFLNIPSYKLNF